MKVTQPLTVYLPDSRGVEISRYGMGNIKLGPNVFTYSRPAGKQGGTCPGSTIYCENICYAKRIGPPVSDVYHGNRSHEVPPIPAECRLLRIHVSGDFDSESYISNWVMRLTQRPDVRAWVYTRSWRVPALLPALEVLRALPNMQLFASMENVTAQCLDAPPEGWRMSWIAPKNLLLPSNHTLWIGPNRSTRSFICPEEVGKVAHCEDCGYCIKGQKHDVTFLEH